MHPVHAATLSALCFVFISLAIILVIAWIRAKREQRRVMDLIELRAQRQRQEELEGVSRRGGRDNDGPTFPPGGRQDRRRGRERQRSDVEAASGGGKDGSMKSDPGATAPRKPWQIGRGRSKVANERHETGLNNNNTSSFHHPNYSSSTNHLSNFPDHELLQVIQKPIELDAQGPKHGDDHQYTRPSGASHSPNSNAHDRDNKDGPQRIQDDGYLCGRRHGDSSAAQNEYDNYDDDDDDDDPYVDPGTVPGGPRWR